MKQLTSQDAAFLYLESRHAHLGLAALNVYQQPDPPIAPLGFADVAQRIQSRLDDAPLLRQKLLRPPLDLDYPWWADDPLFDPQAHLHRYAGPPPRTLRELHDIVAGLHSEPLDLSRPPWEMHVLEQLDHIEGLPPRCFAVISRYHHAALDGAAGSQLVDALHDAGPSRIATPVAKEWSAAHPPGPAELLIRGAVNNARRPLRLLRALAQALPAAPTLLGFARALSGGGEGGAVPLTPFNAAVSSQRVLGAMTIGLNDIRAIRAAVPGATVNDVILAICGGGLRAWLKARGELPAESLVAMVPVNLRGPDEADLGGNRLGQIFIPLHTEIQHPLERLRAVSQATGTAKTAVSGALAETLREALDSMPSLPLSAAGFLLTSLGLGHRALRLCNCTITNVPGPAGALWLGPAKLVHASGCGPVIDGMGLIISVFTYEERITFSFTSCPGMLRDPDELAEHSLQAFRLLKRKTLPAKSRGSARPRA